MRKSKIQNLHPNWTKIAVEGTIPIYDKILNEIILLFKNETTPKKEDIREIIKTYTGLRNNNTIYNYINAYIRYIMGSKLIDVSVKVKLFKLLRINNEK